MATTNSQIAYEYYISQGMSPAGAAGIVGNLFVESGVNPRVTPGDGGIARGIAQWHPDRWERWVVRDPLNTSPGGENELQTQLHASVAEMKSMGVWNALKGMTDPGAAARYVNDHYEISASRNGPAPNRVNAAHEAYDNHGVIKGSFTGHDRGVGDHPTPPGDDAADHKHLGVDHVRPIEHGQLSDTWHAARSGGRLHEGIDIFAPAGSPIHAVTGGTVVQGFSNKLGGVVVRIQGDDGNYYYYAHLKPGSEKALHVGQHVDTGDVIGQVGNSGDAATTQPHLHLQVRVGNDWVNPYTYLQPFPDMSSIDSSGQLDSAGGHAGADPADTAAAHADPYSATPKPFVDADHDGLSDDFEKIIGTDPHAADSDHDGLSDYQEALVTHTDPLSADTDHDGERDALAVALGHNPGFVPLSPAAQAALAAGGAAAGVPAGGGGAASGDELTHGFETAVGGAGAGAGGAGAATAGAGTSATGASGVHAMYDPTLGVGGAGGASLPGSTQLDPDGGITVRQANWDLLHIRLEHPDETAATDPLAHGGIDAHADPGHA